MNLRPHIENLKRRFSETEALLSAPNVFDNPRRAQELSREHARLKDIVAAGEAFLKTSAELTANRELLAAEPAASEMAALLKEEVARLEVAEQWLHREVQVGLLPPEPTDSRNTIFEIRAGAGGQESALFAADLYRMYARYAEARGWKISEEKNKWYLEQLAKNGMTVAPPSAQLKTDFKKIGETITQEWLKTAGPDGKAIVDAFHKP